VKQNLYAIFDKDGQLSSPACTRKWQAWMYTAKYPVSIDTAIRRAKREGYTCEEVEIVRRKQS